MRATPKHYVTFYSPGTLFSEQTTKPIEAWDTRIAAGMAGEIQERHGARPYGFRFSMYLECEPVEMSGETFKVEPKETKRSGLYFLGGTIRTRAEVLAGTDPSEEILRSNVECNGLAAVIENCNSYRATLPFGKDDALVDADGNVVVRGSEV